MGKLEGGSDSTFEPLERNGHLCILPVEGKLAAIDMFRPRKDNTTNNNIIRPIIIIVIRLIIIIIRLIIII